MQYVPPGYKQPRCQTMEAGRQCKRGADVRDVTGRLACSGHALVQCACGRGMVAERLAADGIPCQRCEADRLAYDMQDDRTWEAEGW